MPLVSETKFNPAYLRNIKKSKQKKPLAPKFIKCEVGNCEEFGSHGTKIDGFSRRFCAEHYKEEKIKLKRKHR